MRDHDAGEYASPACSRHELDPGYLDGANPPRDVVAWRGEQRARLIAARTALAPAQRARRDGAIRDALDAEIRRRNHNTLSLVWPIQGEPDVRPLFERLAARGIVLALPVVVAKDRPLAFHAWAPGEALARGVWGIPVPVKTSAVVPELIVAPVVGFDAGGHRLGHGGGYYDRTLAALSPRPAFLGVGYAEAELPTIHPQPHDQRLDAVVTEDGVRRF